MTATIALQLSNHLPEIAILLEQVEAFGDDHHLPARVVFGLSLSLDEVLTNVINYGFPEGGEHTLAVTLSLDGPVLTATVVDDGQAYDPTRQPEPDLTLSVEDRPIGGLGILFARRMMDEIAYLRDGKSNRLTLIKHLDRDNSNSTCNFSNNNSAAHET